jgi:hypothetical protein
MMTVAFILSLTLYIWPVEPIESDKKEEVELLELKIDEDEEVIKKNFEEYSKQIKQKQNCIE